MESTTAEEVQITGDGGVTSIVSVFTYYKGNPSSIDLITIETTYNPANPFKSIERIANDLDLNPVIYSELNVATIKEHLQPIIINISRNNRTPHLVVCLGYHEEDGFIIEDGLSYRYYATDNGLDSMWNDKKCIAFIP